VRVWQQALCYNEKTDENFAIVIHNMLIFKKKKKKKNEHAISASLKKFII
jgi:hypothetical protein